MAETWYRRPKRLNRWSDTITSDTVETHVNCAKTMVGMAETWYRRPKRLNVGKRKKQTIHVGYGENTSKVGENDGRNGKNVVPEAETAKRRKTEETDHSRRIRWKNVKTGRKRWSEWRKRGAGGRNGYTSENGRNGPFTSDTVETREIWAKTMVGMAKTWCVRPKRLNVGKRKKRAIHVGYGGKT